jgi:hypothetical protein
MIVATMACFWVRSLGLKMMFKYTRRQHWRKHLEGDLNSPCRVVLYSEREHSWHRFSDSSRIRLGEGKAPVITRLDESYIIVST